MPRLTLSIIALSVAFLVGVASSCEAQRPRLFQRLAASSSQASAAPSQFKFHQNQAKKYELGRYSTYRNPLVSRILDGPIAPSKRDPIENNFRYTGGFHQSHFDNIGIPSGDIGIRGNAYNWRPW